MEAGSGSGLGLGGMMSLPLRLLRFIASTTVWSLVSTKLGSGRQQWLQGLGWPPGAPSGPPARDQGRQ